MPADAVAIVVAEPGGQTISVAGLPVIGRVLTAVAAVDGVAEVVLAPVGGLDQGAYVLVAALRLGAPLRIAAAAPSRVAAVLAALELAAPAKRVLIHDANRPLAGPGLFAAVLAAASGPWLATAAVPLRSTAKLVRSGVVAATVDRDRIRLPQTPRACSWTALAGLVATGRGAGPEAADEIELALAAGLEVRIVEGDPANVSVRSPGSARYAELVLASR